jgi:hypothetical protein
LKRTYNKALIAAAVILAPPVVFWILVLPYAAFGAGYPLLKALADLEASPAGTVVLVTVVIGCPFFALPLAVVGRWLAEVKGQKGEGLGRGILIVSVVLLVLGVTIPIILR